MSRDWTPLENHLADEHIHKIRGHYIHEGKLYVSMNTPEENKYVEDLANTIDDICYDYDYYGYQDALVGTREDNVNGLKGNITSGDIEHIVDGLTVISTEYQNMIKDLEDRKDDLSDVERDYLAECKSELKKTDKAVSDVKEYEEKHRCFNDRAREEFPNLSFLLSGFEMKVFDSLTPNTDGKYEFYKVAEQFTALEMRMSEITFADHTDEMMSLCDDKSDLQRQSKANDKLGDLVKKWYEGNLVDSFYDARENANEFYKEFDRIFEEMSKMQTFGKGESKKEITNSIGKENRQRGNER